MSGARGQVVAVLGATGLQGGAVARRLLHEGWRVRALTRDPRQGSAKALAALGADLWKVDAADPSSLEPAFDGAHGVYSVHNHHLSSYEGEVAQGRNVVDVAARVGVPHLVYSGAGIGVPGTGVGSWETKVEIAAHLRSLDVPATILRPMAFMELMTERKFFPPASTWHVMPKLMGATRPVVWLAIPDLAAIVARVFADPQRFVGRDLMLAGDVRSLDECREIWRRVTGRPPRRVPMPVPVFERFVGTDETTMWRWLATNDIDRDTGPTREILPEVSTVEQWLVGRMSADGRTASGGRRRAA